jgi:opacity protein-like surface antigen
MRAVIIGLATSLFAGQAIAADYLRGSSWEGPPPARSFDWSGIYVGGQIGYTNANFGFGGATQDLVANMVRDLLVETEAGISHLPSLTKKDSRNTAYGGFMGYNAQWGQVVLGIEGNYSHTSITGASTDSIGRSFVTSNEFRNDVIVDSVASATLKDYATLRLRAGYAWDWVMPYMTAGFAVGVVDYNRYARVRITETDVSAAALDLTDGIAPRPGGSLDESTSDAKTNAIAYGYSLGGGVDVGITQNLFVRGEYEFVQFHKVGGIPIQISTFRVGAAAKF